MTAVVYIRPQPPLANSSYTQVVKSFQFEGSFDDFITKRLDGAAWHMNERLGVWFDQPNIRFIAVPFTPENTGSDIAAKMLKLAGIPSPRVDGLGLEFPGYVNKAPGPLAVAAFRMLARGQRYFRDLKNDTRTRRAAKVEAKRRGWFRDRFVGLDERRAARIRTLFEEENERFARRFFARPWHDVFAADYERLWEPNEIELDAIAPDQKAALDDFLVTITANSSTPDGVEEQGE